MLLKKKKLIDQTELARRRVKTWTGHNSRIRGNRWTSRITYWKPYEGKRPRGRPLPATVNIVLRTVGVERRQRYNIVMYANTEQNLLKTHGHRTQLNATRKPEPRTLIIP